MTAGYSKPLKTLIRTIVHQFKPIDVAILVPRTRKTACSITDRSPLECWMGVSTGMPILIRPQLNMFSCLGFGFCLNLSS